jgi:hypothetical protein
VAQVADDSCSCSEMGQRGREFVNKNLLLPEILLRYAEVIEVTARRQEKTYPVWEPIAGLKCLARS